MTPKGLACPGPSSHPFWAAPRRVWSSFWMPACHSDHSGADGLGTNDDAVASPLTGPRAPMLVSPPRAGSSVTRIPNGEALQTDWRSADLNGNGVIEVSELYRALRSIVWPDAGPTDTLTRPAGTSSAILRCSDAALALAARTRRARGCSS